MTSGNLWRFLAVLNHCVQAQCKSNKSAVLRSKRTGGFCASRALPLGSSYTYGTRLLHYYYTTDCTTM